MLQPLLPPLLSPLQFVYVCPVLGGPKPNLVSQSGLTSAVQRGVIPSLNPWAMFLFIQPQKLLAYFASRVHHWFTYSSLPTTTLGLLPQSCSPAHPAPAGGVTEALPAMVQDLTYHFAEFHAVHVVPFFQPASLSLNSSSALGSTVWYPNLVSPANMGRVHSVNVLQVERQRKSKCWRLSLSFNC